MASFLRPRRGKRATAISQNIILKKGEVFFEVPDSGVGKGLGKIKIGDGTTGYNSLPYFLEPTDVDAAGITFTEATSTNNTTLLNAIKSGASLSTIVGNTKKMLRNLNSSVTSLNTEVDGSIKNASVSGRVITFTKNNGSTFSLTTQDTNTTYSNYKGASSSSAGTAGLVPPASTSTYRNFLRGDGTWAVPSNASTAEYATNASTASYASNAGSAGYANNAGTSSYSNTAGYANNAGTSSYSNTAGVSNRTNLPRVNYAYDENFPSVGTVSFREHSNGNINGPGPDTAFYHVITQQSMDPGYATQLALGMTTTKAAYKRYDGADGDSDWNIFITDKNYQDYIKAITYNGGDRTIIPANSDLNDYTTYGIYKCGTDGATITLNNCPTDYAFLLDVIPSTGQDRAFDEAPEGASVWMSYATQILYTWTNEFFSRVITISVNGSNTSYGWGVWRRILNSTNYNEYAPTLTGTGASGTWGINITGTAKYMTVPRIGNGDYNSDTIMNKAYWREFEATSTNGPSPTNAYYYTLNVTGGDDRWAGQLALGMTTNTVAYRRMDANYWHDWQYFLTSYNYNTYAPSLTGSGASGTWNINVTGTASTATYAHGANEASYANNNYLPRVAYAYTDNMPDSSKANWREFSSGASGAPSEHFYHVFTGHSADPNFYTQLALGMTIDRVAYKRSDFGNSTGWHTFITDKNYGSYTEKSHPMTIFSSSQYSTYADAIFAKKAEGYTSGVLCASGWHPTDMPASGDWSTVWWRCSCGYPMFSIQLYIDRDISLWFGTLANGENNNQITWSRAYTNNNKPSASDIGAATANHTHSDLRGDGLLELGQYLDFHLNGSTTDYDQRLFIDSEGFYFTGTMQGLFKTHAGTDYTTSRLRNVMFSTSAPSSLANGEICFVYE